MTTETPKEMEVLAEYDGLDFIDIQEHIKPLLAEHFPAENIYITFDLSEMVENGVNSRANVNVRWHWDMARMQHRKTQHVSVNMIHISPLPWVVCLGVVDPESKPDRRKAKWRIVLHNRTEVE